MNKIVFIMLITLTTGLMGSAFAIGKIGLIYSSPMFLVAARFLLAGIIMIIVVKIMNKKLPTDLKNWIWIILIGLFQSAMVMGCIFIALKTISSGAASILVFMNPLFVVILGTILLKIKYAIQQWIGVVIGLIGVFITMEGQLHFETGTILGITAAISWAIATLLVKIHGHKIDTWVLTAYQMLFGGIFLLIASIMLENVFFTIHEYSIIILFWLAIPASIIQFSIWFYLLKKGNPERTSAFLFLVPFFGVLSGWILLEEQLSLSILSGGIFIIIGIFLVNWNFTKRRKKTINIEM